MYTSHQRYHSKSIKSVLISSSAPRPFGAAYVPILISEVEQEQRPSGNRDRETIVVGAGLCDNGDKRAYTAYAPHYSPESFGRVTVFLVNRPLFRSDRDSLPIVRDNLPKIIWQIVPRSTFGKLFFSKLSCVCLL